MEEEAHGIVIIGGGICGLATALALQRKGIACLVLEKSESLRADGAAIGVHANGWRVLEQLGVAEELRNTANLITAYPDQTEQGNYKIGLIPVRKEFRCLKRKDLIETLARSIPVGAIRFGCGIAAIHSDPASNGAVLTTVDGGTMRAKVLVGCDGANSVVAKYLGLSAPEAIPRTTLRGFTRYPHGHPFRPEFLRLRGPGFVVGRLPVTDDLVHFFVAMPSPPTDPGVAMDVNAVKDRALQRMRGCPAELTEMVRGSDPDSLNVVTRIWFRPPWQVAFGCFQRGGVTVAGDAMHAMAPVIGQGGSSGLEDAVVLARTLSRAMGGAVGEAENKEVIGAAIGKYVRERRPRIAMLSLESFVTGKLLRAKSLVVKLACLAVLALLGSRSLRHTSFDCGRL